MIPSHTEHLCSVSTCYSQEVSARDSARIWPMLANVISSLSGYPVQRLCLYDPATKTILCEVYNAVPISSTLPPSSPLYEDVRRKYKDTDIYICYNLGQTRKKEQLSPPPGFESKSNIIPAVASVSFLFSCFFF